MFQALSSDARRLVVERLSRGELTISETTAPLEMSFAAASKHVQVLEAAGLVQRQVQGRRHVCSLVPGGLREAAEWLALADSATAQPVRQPPAPVVFRRPTIDEEVD